MCETFLKWCICTIVLLCTNLIATSQSIQRVDSLNHAATLQQERSPDSVTLFAQAAFSMSQEIGYPKGQIEALSNLGFACYIRGENEKALQYCREAISISVKNGSGYDLSAAYSFLGLTYIQMKEYDEGINQFINLIDHATKQKDNLALADACSNIGMAYMSKGALNKAKEYYRIAAKIHEDIDHPDGKAYVELNLGQIYFTNSHYDSAKYYLQRALQTGLKVNNQRVAYYCYSILGQLTDIPRDQAKDMLIRALQLARDLNWEKEQVNARINLANYYIRNQQEALILEQIGLALALTQRLNLPEKTLECYEILIRYFSQSQKQRLADEYSVLHRRLSDSIQKNNHSHLLEGIIEANKKMSDERSYDQVKLELEAAQLRIRQKNLIIFAIAAGISVVLLVLLFIVQLSRIRAKSNQELRELNDQLDASIKDKDLILGIIAHDLRSPLDKIHGLINLLKNKNQDPETDMLAQMITSVVTESRRLTDELLEMNELDSNKKRIKKEEIDLEELIDESIYHYQNKADEKELSLQSQFELDRSTIQSDRGILQRVIENLLSNAIKFSPREGQILLDVHSTDHELKISIRDTGPGIPEEERKMLFKRFGKTSIRPTANEPSTGLGLYIVQSLIHCVDGQIYLNESYEDGAEFVVKVPI